MERRVEDVLCEVLTVRYPRNLALDPTLWLWDALQDLSDTVIGSSSVRRDLGLPALVAVCRTVRACLGRRLQIRCYSCERRRGLQHFNADWAFIVWSDVNYHRCRLCRAWGNVCKDFRHPRCQGCCHPLLLRA